jgi:hypothetical protein
MDKCYERMRLVNASTIDEPGMKEPTRPDLLSGRGLLVELKEVKNQSNEEKAREKKALESALRTLAEERIKPGPVPVPRSVWQYMLDSFGVEDADDKEFPNLNEATTKALIQQSSTYDSHPEEWMLELGNYLVGAFASNEMVGFIRDLGHFTAMNPTKLAQPRRVAQLAFDLIEDATSCTGFQSFKRTAGILLYLSKDELQQEAELAGHGSSGTKAEVVIRFIELFYADVLIPSQAEE